MRPHIEYCSQEATGFEAGKNPIRLVVYNKGRELLGKTDHVYNEAMKSRRWCGEYCFDATRVEYQLGRRWLRDHGIGTPFDFLEKQGTLSEYLTHDFFRITERPVDRKNKHQSRAETHALWQDIREAFGGLSGEPVGDLTPLDRGKIDPIELIKQARGCLVNALLQKGFDFSDYQRFVDLSTSELLRLGRHDDAVKRFMEEVARRRMDYEG